MMVALEEGIVVNERGRGNKLVMMKETEGEEQRKNGWW